MTAPHDQAMQSLTQEQREALYAYRMALRLHDGRLLSQPRVIFPATPAVGADWTITVPGGVNWVVISARWKFVASATVATRVSGLQVKQDVTTLYVCGGAGPITASQTWFPTFIRNLGEHASGAGTAALNSGGPVAPVPGGFTLGSLTSGLDVGDTVSQPVLFVIETRERTSNEMINFAEDLAAGAHVDLYPGLMLGL